MSKKIFSYIFILILSTSVVLPACINIFDTNHDISLEIDIDEEIEDIELTKNSETKIIPSNFIYPNYLHFPDKNETIFIAKKYNSIFQKIDSPPPDLNFI